MLSYQHHYHAGNHADILKHWLLSECLSYMQKKQKPFDYIDTHSGAGIYDLNSTKAKKTAESTEGISKLDWHCLPKLETYSNAVRSDFLQGNYPGSPLIVARQLRSQDKAWLFEMHPQTYQELNELMGTNKEIHVRQQDGFQGLIGLLPNPARRALVLIDPSYEIKSDYDTVVDVISKVYKKMPQTMLLLWYPLVDRRRVIHMENTLRSTNIKNLQLFEMSVKDDRNEGMTGSGMIIMNPPWTLKDTFNQSINALTQQLSQDGKIRYRFQQLTEE